MMCVVTKAFLGGGREYVPNELIDAAVFGPKTQTLITTRFLRQATQDEIENARYEDDEPAPVVQKKPLKAKKLKARKAR